LRNLLLAREPDSLWVQIAACCCGTGREDLGGYDGESCGWGIAKETSAEVIMPGTLSPLIPPNDRQRGTSEWHPGVFFGEEIPFSYPLKPVFALICRLFRMWVKFFFCSKIFITKM
jgi:hypothetical protein